MDADAPARTARVRAREQITAEILRSARRHLASDGAAGLSLRAIARELGFASSAVYRYVSSRDELLTELLVSSYDDFGRHVERAAHGCAEDPPAQRWVLVAAAVRTWAVAHPHEWALLYGSPVPGYEAPPRTVEPGIRASLALLSVLRDAVQLGWSPPTVPGAAPTLDPGRAAVLADDLAALARTLEWPDGADPAGLVPVLAAWTQTFGLVSLEVFGQTVGITRDDEALFLAGAAATAAALGLPAGRPPTSSPVDADRR